MFFRPPICLQKWKINKVLRTVAIVKFYSEKVKIGHHCLMATISSVFENEANCGILRNVFRYAMGRNDGKQQLERAKIR